MKYIFTCLLSVLLSGVAFGQKIHFTDTANRWISLCYEWYAPQIQYNDSSFRYTGDTIYNGQHYLITNYQSPGFSGTWNYLLVREDTAAGKVYARNYWQDTTERLLYDYTLVLNDTFRTHDYSGNVPITVYCVVSHYDSLLLNNVWHKRWQFHVYSGGVGFTVIEGIGCLVVDLLYPLQPNAVEYQCGLCGLKQYGNYVYGSATACNPVGIQELNQDIHPAVTVPNPCVAADKMSFSRTVQKGKLCFYNTSGRQVATVAISGDHITPGDYLSLPGIYFYVFCSGGGQIFTGRFLFQ